MSTILKLINNITSLLNSCLGFFTRRSKCKELTENEKAKKLTEEKAKHIEAIDKAVETGDLEDVRKSVSE